MTSRLRSFRYANIVSTLALLLALGGTATAAGLPQLITGAQIRNGSLTGDDLANHSIGLVKLTDAAIADLNRSVNNDAVAGPAGPAGPQGPAGPVGSTGPEGAAGAAGTGITLAGYATADDQSIPGDGDPHTIWTMNVTAHDRQVFILTGAIGGSNIDGGCSGSGGTSDALTVDGSPPAGGFNGGFLTLAAGPHTVSYVATDDCTGQPADVPAQQAVLIPFDLP